MLQIFYFFIVIFVAYMFAFIMHYLHNVQTEKKQHMTLVVYFFLQEISCQISVVFLFMNEEIKFLKCSSLAAIINWMEGDGAVQYCRLYESDHAQNQVTALSVCLV